MANKNENMNLMDAKINYFKFDLKADNLQKTFAGIYQKNNGNWSAVKAELEAHADFTPAVVKNLEFTQHLALWSKDSDTVIAVFQKDTRINSLRDIALLNKASFIEKVATVAPDGTNEEKQHFALNLRTDLFHIEPTAMLVNMVKDPQVSLLNNVVGANVAALLEKKPDFNIKKTSVYELLKNEEVLEDIPLDTRESVKTQLKTLQRVMAVSPEPEAVPVLYNANLHTALQISSMPLAQFKSAMSEKGLDEGALLQIHSNAQQATARNEQTLIALRDAGKSTGIALIDKSMNANSGTQAKMFSMNTAKENGLQQVIEKNNLSWDLLFGDADFCECGECNSVYSATAYYVELLQYLRNNNLDPSPANPIPIKANASDISNTPLEKLFSRRPDLGCLELTCKNTNTILPYVDLVNEVMENYVAYKKLKPFNVEDETSSELLAEPQHTEYQAYCILKNAVYPFTLPYHQPIDAARIYLNYLGSSRFDVINTFRRDNSNSDTYLTQLKNEAIDKAADAEFLSITKEEYVILTKECFENKTLMEKIKNKTYTEAEYQTLIGVKPVCEYYGFDTDTSMLGEGGLTLIKKEFIPRTGIDYFNLVDLLKAEYINPCLPKGKSLAIMESLRFSYRFLQNFALAFGVDKMAEFLVQGEKLADLLPLLKEGLDLLRNKKVLACPHTGEDKLNITDKDIINWVKCHFEKVGKMIVIETGRACVNGTFVGKGNAIGHFEIIARDCKILIGEGVEKKEIASIDRKTGKITPSDPAIPLNISEFSQFTFVSDKGEKGILLPIGEDIYLIFLQQQDSCNLDTALLQHLDGSPLTTEEYDRIHRFIRLWRKLGWTINEVDKAIVALSAPKAADLSGEVFEHSSVCDECGDECNDCGCDDNCNDCDDEKHSISLAINPHLLYQIVAIKKLLDKTGLELIQLLAFWGAIDTAGEKSLYERLFLTHNVQGIDKVFRANNAGHYLTGDETLLDHLPAVMAALNLSADDIKDIILATAMDDKLSVENVSTLYRYRLLAKLLGLKINALVKVLPLFGDVFNHAHASLDFLQVWEKIEAAGFSHQQLNYVINNIDDDKKPFTPAAKQILQLGKTLYDGLNAIDEAHKDVAADPTLSAVQQLINIQEKATSELVRAKASLLFDTAIVEKINGYLEGSIVYATNAPKNLDLLLPDTKTLKRKLNYDKTAGWIQITGILTDEEVFDFNAMNSDLQLKNALVRIQKQQSKLFKELLSGIFASEKSISAAEKAQLESIIKGSDISVPLDSIPDGDPDINSAPKKRVAFLAIFLPYLRQELTHRFVVETLAAFVGLEARIVDLLITDVVKLGTPALPVYSIFENIKDSSKPSEVNWSGYLIPAADAHFTFIVKDSAATPVVSIDGVPLVFTAQEDPTNEWWSNSVLLQAGKLYKLATVALELKNLYWKTPASVISLLPSSALIPDFTSSQCEPALIALKKAALLISIFNLNVDELRFLTRHSAHFSNLDFNAFTLTHWLRLDAYTRLRNSLPSTSLTLLDFFAWTFNDASDVADLNKKIAELTGWRESSIAALIDPVHFNIGKLNDYRDENSLLKLQNALVVSEKIGVAIDLLFDWAVPSSKFKNCRTIADSIKYAIRARYNQTDWELVVKPLHDQLRNNQKDALIAYLLQQPELIAWNITDADGLFEYFLIDVQMCACMETSRIKQAISSVQLFVQRCFLGLEEEHNGIAPNILDRPRWDWMQRYRVWEANRKVFLYPENWIESNLRDDKSPFFKELESELLQKDINKQNVIDALKSYLYKVDDVANMQVVGLYIDGTTTSGPGGVSQWNKNSRLHVFSRTRNAPYFFFYRYFALDELNWYPWEKMQVDIPGYDVEDPASHEVTDNGCYLTPVVWNNRLLVFFPQIMKKTKPNATAQNQPVKTSADSSPAQLKPTEYCEVKMAWSEYRNNKWSQKQISKDAVFSSPIDNTHNIQYFKFVPVVFPDKVIINVDDLLDSDGGYKGAFVFDGTALKLGNAVPTAAIPINYFNQEGGKDGKLYSWQFPSSNVTVRNTAFYSYEVDAKENLHGANYSQTVFHHPHTKNLLGKISLGQVDQFFKENLVSLSINDFGPFVQDDDPITANIYHELKSPYSLYNWELFFHTPILLANELCKAQHFEEAMKWFHFVFNPLADGTDDNRFWQFTPFKDINSQQVLDSIFNNLKPNKPDQAINEWRNKPFMPHVIARSRPVAYMKWVVMKYIDNIIAWGDYLFRQDTIETINQATQLYILAGHILGPKPMMIPKRGTIKPQTYLGLLDKWDAFGNAMVELELAAPFSNQTTLPVGVVNGEIALANIFGLASSLYFCIPNNPKLMGYWDTLADRLYKIRHCENIDGVFRKLPLFEPPIDPALLVRAAAQGLSIASVLNDLNAPMPNYRFYYLLQKSLELCNELKNLGAAMLSAIEKKDNETLSLIRSKHENTMHNLLMEIKKKQLDEAQKNLEGLQQNRKTPEARMKYYLKLSGLDEGLVPNDTAEFNGLPNSITTVDGDSGLKLIPFEKEDMDKAADAQSKQVAAALPEKIASILHIIPNFSGNIQPFGIGMSITLGGSNLGAAAQAWAKFLQLDASELTYASVSASKKGGFTRALQERIFQANAAGFELKQIDKQITSQLIRIDIANQEISNQQKQIDNAVEVEEFLKNKYSNEELYSWMRGNLKTLYHQVYSLAYELAKKAEKTYCFERGLTGANFIQSGYFDAGRDGLLAGEQLYVGLKQLEAAYQSERGYDFEITKHISLQQLNPLTVIQLRQTGKCDFVLPEVLFDLDFPGHYKRRIKSVSISIPCIAGPYTSVNATLRLLENKFRNTAVGGKAYEEDIEETDARFTSYNIPINAIATSTAQNDSGIFEISFKDERYLPFEGAGAISRWELELPTLKRFDYNTISDVIVHVKYTSSEGGERLKLAAAKSLAKQLGNIEQELNETGLHLAFNMKHDMPNQWKLLKLKGEVSLTIDKSMLPYMVQFIESPKLENLMFLGRVKNSPNTFTININDEALVLQKINEWNLCKGLTEDLSLGEALKISIASPQLDQLEELMLVVKYKF